MAKRRTSAGTPATAILAQAKVPFEILDYDHTSAELQSVGYGLAAAAALGVPAEQVFKTLVAEVDAQLTVAVVPTSAQLNLKALAAACSAKSAKMADPQVVQRVTGYVLGGVSPLGQRKVLPTIIDSSSLAFDRILVSAGKRGADIALNPEDLIALTKATVADISSAHTPQRSG